MPMGQIWSGIEKSSGEGSALGRLGVLQSVGLADKLACYRKSLPRIL